jgi:hypothetical protein
MKSPKAGPADKYEVWRVGLKGEKISLIKSADTLEGTRLKVSVVGWGYAIYYRGKFLKMTW